MHGEVGRGLRYRAYVMAPLDAAGFSADEGVRGGRQKGAEANVRNVATTGRVEYVSATDDEAVSAFQWLSEKEGILPALESSHALAFLIQRDNNIEKDDNIIICLSGRGDKDVHTVADYLGKKI